MSNTNHNHNPKNKPNLIVISGKKGVGKDTLADYIISKTADSLQFSKIAQADKLKKITQKILESVYNSEFPLEWSYDNDQKEKEHPEFIFNGEPLVIRKVLQYFGTEVFRNNFSPDIWVNSVIEEITKNKKNWIITDSRFVNEITAITSDTEIDLIYNIIIVGIKREQEIYGSDDVHASEEGIIDKYPDLFDVVFENNTDSLDHVYLFADELLERCQ